MSFYVGSFKSKPAARSWARTLRFLQAEKWKIVYYTFRPVKKKDRDLLPRSVRCCWPLLQWSQCPPHRHQPWRWWWRVSADLRGQFGTITKSTDICFFLKKNCRLLLQTEAPVMMVLSMNGAEHPAAQSVVAVRNGANCDGLEKWRKSYCTKISRWPR